MFWWRSKAFISASRESIMTKDLEKIEKKGKKNMVKRGEEGRESERRVKKCEKTSKMVRALFWKAGKRL